MCAIEYLVIKIRTIYLSPLSTHKLKNKIIQKIYRVTFTRETNIFIIFKNTSKGNIFALKKKCTRMFKKEKAFHCDSIWLAFLRFGCTFLLCKTNQRPGKDYGRIIFLSCMPDHSMKLNLLIQP